MPGTFGSFVDFVGNATAVRLLQATLAAGRLAHALLLTGPPQVGKRTLASTLAAALICPRPASVVSNESLGWQGTTARFGPCGECLSCRLLSKDTHPDVRLIAPEAGRRGVTIEQVRQLEHAAGLRPYEAKRKVFVVRGADAMPDPAANALLKTLEEPPDDTVLVLTASDASQVLPTIASRCREIPLRPVPAAEIEAALVSRGVPQERARLLARLAGGRPGWALAAAAGAAHLAAREAHVAALESLLRRPRVGRLRSAGDFGDAASAKAVLDVWLGWWRDTLLVQQHCVDLVANVDRLEPLRHAGTQLSPETIWRALVRIQEARQQLDANANVRLALEALLLDLPEVPRLPAIATTAGNATDDARA
ncbi:MAG: DNA polymerase III subunit delta' [Chloroflexi bacterium]|nr:DNA polymerase III subunit delta' [Chloroflexota bacterium]